MERQEKIQHEKIDNWLEGKFLEIEAPTLRRTIVLPDKQSYALVDTLSLAMGMSPAEVRENIKKKILKSSELRKVFDRVGGESNVSKEVLLRNLKIILEPESPVEEKEKVTLPDGKTMKKKKSVIPQEHTPDNNTTEEESQKERNTIKPKKLASPNPKPIILPNGQEHAVKGPTTKLCVEMAIKGKTLEQLQQKLDEQNESLSPRTTGMVIFSANRRLIREGLKISVSPTRASSGFQQTLKLEKIPTSSPARKSPIN